MSDADLSPGLPRRGGVSIPKSSEISEDVRPGTSSPVFEIVPLDSRSARHLPHPSAVLPAILTIFVIAVNVALLSPMWGEIWTRPSLAVIVVGGWAVGLLLAHTAVYRLAEERRASRPPAAPPSQEVLQAQAEANLLALSANRVLYEAADIMAARDKDRIFELRDSLGQLVHIQNSMMEIGHYHEAKQIGAFVERLEVAAIEQLMEDIK